MTRRERRHLCEPSVANIVHSGISNGKRPLSRTATKQHHEHQPANPLDGDERPRGHREPATDDRPRDRGSSSSHAAPGASDLAGVVGAAGLDRSSVRRDRADRRRGRRAAPIGPCAAPCRPVRPQCSAEHDRHEQRHDLEHEHDGADRRPLDDETRQASHIDQAAKPAHDATGPPTGRPESPRCLMFPYASSLMLAPSTVDAPALRRNGTGSLPLLWVPRSVNDRRPTER